MKQIASEFKEMLTMPTMRSVSPKPTFRIKEKEEKDTADVTSKKADGAFASSSLERRRRGATCSGEILKFLNHFYT